MFLHQLNHPQILDNKGVRLQLFEDGEGCNHMRQILLSDQTVGGKVELQPMLPTIVDHGGDFFEAEVTGQVPGVKTRGADIDGVSTSLNGSPKGLHIAGRGK